MPKSLIAVVVGAIVAPLLTVLPPGAAQAAQPAHADPTRFAAEPMNATSAASAPVASAAGVRWKRCSSGYLRGSGLKCANLRVPMDPADPAGPTVTIALSRLKHTAPQRRYRGVLLLNPGGPGGSGLSMPTVAGDFPRSVAARYDWIGFDPRGVGASRPRVTCDKDFFGFDRPDYVPRTKKILREWQRRSRTYARDCAANGEILQHMRTTDSVADMEAIRVALGARRINYFGFSYGTYLGQIYATLHPDRVDRMVLDGNVDPQRAFYQANLDQDPAMQQNLERWFDWIAKRPGTFRLGNTGQKVMRAFNRTSRELGRTPALGKIGPSEWIDTFLSVAYSRSAWFGMASVFANYVNFDKAGQLVRAYKSAGDFGDDNGFAVYSAVQCVDAPWPLDWATWSRDNWRVYRKAPNTTWMNAWFNAQCRHWPVSAGPRFTVDGAAAPAMLLVGGTYDGATPFAGSLTVRSLFPRSRLVEMVRDTTHANSLGTRCSRGYVTRFFGSGALPARVSGDRADVRCPLKGRGLG